MCKNGLLKIKNLVARFKKKSKEELEYKTEEISQNIKGNTNFEIKIRSHERVNQEIQHYFWRTDK